MVLRDLLYPLRATFKKKDKPVGAAELEAAFQEQLKTVWDWFATDLNFPQQKVLLDGLLSRSVGVLQAHVASSLQALTRRDFLGDLPVEISLHVLSFLEDDPASLARCAQVSRTWRALADDNLRWHAMCMRKGWSPPSQAEQEVMDRMEQAYENLWWGTTLDHRPQQIQRYNWKQVYVDTLVARRSTERNWRDGRFKKENVMAHGDEISCLMFDDIRLVCGSYDGTVKVWNSATNQLMGALMGHTDGVTCVQFNHRFIITGSLDRTLRVWDFPTGECLRVLQGHEGEVECVCLRGNHAASGSWDNSIRVWDIESGQCLNTLTGHTGSVYCVQFDAEKLISAGGDRLIKIWSWATGACVRSLAAHQDTITTLQYDDRSIITGSYDGEIKTFDLKTGHCISTLSAHEGEVWSLQFDDDKIVSGSGDGTIKIWSRETGTCSSVLRHDTGINCLQFDYRKIISGARDHCLQLWDFGVS